MVREDIVAGLRNAIERGYSLEQAKQSFVSAGYPRAEVEEAAHFVYAGALAAESTENAGNRIQTLTKTQQIPKYKELKETKPTFIKKIEERFTGERLKFIKEKVERDWKLILLVGFLAILVLVLILTLVFREKIIGWFS